MRNNYLTQTFLVFLLSCLSYHYASATKSDLSEESYFQLVCPANVTIECGDDIYNLDQYGQAFIHTHIGIYPAGEPTVYYNLNECGIGIIVRTWWAEDEYWNWTSCSQVITVIGGGLKPHHISWPPDYTYFGCTADIHPDNLPYPYNRPVITYTECSHPGIGYDDWEFTLPDGCKKIIRTWKVIDWCVWKPNSGTDKGLYMKNQTIKIMSTGTVTLKCPDDITVSSGADCQGTTVNIPNVTVHSDCPDSQVNVTHNSPYAFNQGRNASGRYPIGTTIVTFTAKQACGALAKCSFKITVTPDKKPSPICTDEIVVVLMPIDTDDDGIADEGMITIPAKLLDKGSFHGCYDTNLRFSWSTNPNDTHRTFTCEDLGLNPVRMYVTDEFGNQDYCSVHVMVQNNSGIIDCFPSSPEHDSITGWIGGLLTSADDYPIENAQVELSSLGLDTLIQISYDTSLVTITDTIGFDPQGNPIIQITQTQIITPFLDTIYSNYLDTIFAGIGSYSFDTVPVGGSYIVRPFKNDPKEFLYIDYSDINRMVRHLNGTEPFDSPYKLLAADVNGDKLINQKDLFIISNKANKKRDYDSIPLTWNFIPEDFVFEDPNNPFLDNNIPSTIQVDSITSPVLDAHFIGYKLGDVALTGFERRSDKTEFIYIEDKTVNAGDVVKIRLDAEYDLLNFIKLELHSERGDFIITQSDPFLEISREENSVSITSLLPKTSIASSGIYFEFIALVDGKLSDMIRLSDIYESVAIDVEDEVKDIELRFADSNSVVSLQNVNIYPNPFSDFTTLNFEMLSAEKLNLNIFNVEGKVVYTQNVHVERGQNQIQLNREKLGSSGMYIYELTGENTRMTGKLICIE